jgi:hypothetical protein
LQLLNGVISNSHFAEILAETINRAVSKKPERGSSGLSGASEARNTGDLMTVMHDEPAVCRADFTTASTTSASAVSALPADLAHDDDLNHIFQVRFWTVIVGYFEVQLIAFDSNV